MGIELLAPAGGRETLETAFYFGADAAYIAGNRFGLRAFAENFTEEEIAGAVRFAHDLRKKLYVTVNAVLYGAELTEVERHICFLDQTGADGVIFSDPAVLWLARKNNLSIPLHLSTQANTTNHLSAAFWRDVGVERVVLSREVPLCDIAQISRNCPELEIEAFVHGAMCVAHSGRCLLSAAMTGRSGNKGACAQPCRWEYHLLEQGMPGEYFPVMEDGKGTYLLNSKDLMMIGHIPELARAGVTSFKIEGRMKSAYYVASVVGAYRRALDAYETDPEGYVPDESLEEELVKSAARGFTTGFFFGDPRGEAQDIRRGYDPRKYSFVAKVTGETKGGTVWVEQRGAFAVGDVLEVLSPHLRDAVFRVETIVNEDGEYQDGAPHPMQRLRIGCPFDLRAGDILRREG